MQTSINFNSPTAPASFMPLIKGDKWDMVWQNLRDDADLSYTDASRGVSLAGLIEEATSAIYKNLLDGWVFNIAWSSGKDSEVVLHLFLMALVRAVRNGEDISSHHWLVHIDTKIESPEVRYLADEKLAALESFIASECLPLKIIIAKPGVSQSWTGRVLAGRGLPTFSNSSARQCSQDLKVLPAKRAQAAYLKELPADVRKKVCLLLGSRDAESRTRASSIKKQGGSASDIQINNKSGELYVIKKWLQGDVWEMLLNSGSDPKYSLPSYLANNLSTAELYKDAQGECIWSVTEKAKSEACGSRFGCHQCQAIGLDKSMENLLSSNPDQYGYMTGLNRVQRYIAKTRYDWSKRSVIGRTIYAGGYARIQPDVYSPEFLEKLLRVFCSLDLKEEERAYSVALKIEEGELPNDEWHQRMAQPQFRMIDEVSLIHIDWLWSMHHFNDKPFRALEIFHEVQAGKLDLLEEEPDIEMVAPSPIPKPFWVKVEKWDDGSNYDGLADPLAEMVYFDGADDCRATKSIKRANGIRRVVCFEESNEVTIDADTAAWIVWNEYPRLREGVLNGEYTPASATHFYLRFGAISLAKGKASVYQKMMQRGQKYHAMGLTGQQTMESVVERRDLHVLDDAKYKNLVTRRCEAELKKVQWWLVVNFMFYYHGHHQTDFGVWIDGVLKSEQQVVELEQYTLVNNRVVDSLLAYSSAYSLVHIELAEQASNITALKRYKREVKSKAFNALINALEQYGIMILDDAISAYEAILRELNNGKRITCGDWLFTLSKQQPNVLSNHVKVMIRALTNAQCSQLTIRKLTKQHHKEEQLSFILAA